uniref:G-protein coupled receptor 157-like isoform X1 n=1 Tax=Crassostrea virginica TaxID=6565 RepID=A0A8B8EFV2_CRAVI|nr:G-protein coupled receptor 157-like isoform X1 [Crassostrea virginica]
MGKDIYISVITLISGSLSFLGGLMHILSHSCIKRLHYIRRMLVCLTIANIIQASGNLLGTVNYLTLKPLDVSKPDRFCVFQSFLTTFSSIASFNWSSMIAVHVFFCVVRKVQTIPKYVCFVYHVVGWLIPVVISVVVYDKGKLGRGTYNFEANDEKEYNSTIASGQWCWIKVNTKNVTSSDTCYMILAGKGWELATYLIAGVLYLLFKVYLVLQRRRSGHFSFPDTIQQEDERFCYTALLLYLLRFWGTTRFFFAIFGGYKKDFIVHADSVLVYFQCIGDSAQAFSDFLLFCVFDKNFRRRFYNDWRHLNEENRMLLSN